MAQLETVFTMDTSGIKYGPGVTREVGHDMKQLGAHRVMVVTDPNLARGQAVAVALQALRSQHMDVVLYDGVEIEPTDVSFRDAIRVAEDGDFDGYVAVGGGSTMDTAKVADLYATFPADFLDYVNPPVGRGRPVPGRLKPLIAIPTTAGTGSETTGVAIFDFLEMHAKTGIAHRALRPVTGLIDPDNTRTLPPMAAACTGFDIICHALESLTALPYHRRPAPAEPGLRPAYQGANPISDIWAARAIEVASEYILRAIRDPSDDEARGQMILAAAFAGIGFGNAGVHLPHGMSYPVSGMVKSYVAPGYPRGRPLIPHGMSVALNAPAVFRFTAGADPDRHLWAARLLGADVRGVGRDQAGELLARTLVALMRKAGMPNGLRAVGYEREDVPALVAGTLPQQRVTKLSPRSAGEAELARLFLDSMTLW
jgi:hydroxyacid-oxoacid transhydrogenase